METKEQGARLIIRGHWQRGRDRMVLKRSIIVILIISLMFTFIYQGVLAETGDTGTVLCSGLNMRARPDLNSQVIITIDRGEKVSITGETGGWYNIKYKEYTGFVYSMYIWVIGEEKCLGAVSGSNVNVREYPYIGSDIICKFNTGKKVRVLDENYGWYKISFDSGIGWIYGEYLVIIGEPAATAVINSSEVNMRINPSLSSDIIMKLVKWDKVMVYGASGDWYLVEEEKGEFGWVYNSLIDIRKTEASRGFDDEQFIREIDINEVTKLQIRIIEYARKFLGVRYVWGGSNTNGFDCSGLVLYVYKNFDIYLPHMASMQARLGTYVKRSELCAGDLVFFDTNGGHDDITHVGIYMGDNVFIHASSSTSNGKKVTLSRLEGFYERSYMTARRIVN